MFCKIGDIAVLIASEIPSAIGNMYRVLEPDAYGEWLCKPLSAHDTLSIDTATGALVVDAPYTPVVIDDHRLRPIRGLPIAKTVPSKKLELVD